MIKRDGANVSIWQDNMQPYKSVNKVNARAIYDVIIVGGGVTGVSTALLLQNERKKMPVARSGQFVFWYYGRHNSSLKYVAGCSLF